MDFDTDLIKPAGIAALIAGVIYTLVTFLPPILFYTTRVGYPSFYMFYLLIRLILPIICYFLLGFLAVYLLRKQRGLLTPINCVVVTMLAVIFYVVFTGIIYILIALILYSTNVHYSSSQGHMLLGLGFMTLFMLIMAQAFTALFGLIPALIGAVICSIIFATKEEKRLWKVNAWIPVAIIILICLVFFIGIIIILWQMGPSPSGGNIVMTSFSKLKPLAPSVFYSAASGNFTGSFVNTVGTNITITNASVTDKLDESIVWSRPLINDVYPTTNPQIIASGDSFKLDAGDNGAGRHEGDPFDLEITVQYTSVMGGIKTRHTETGRIRGPVE